MTVPMTVPVAALSSTLKRDGKTSGGLFEATMSTQTEEAAASGPTRFVRPPASVTSSAWQ